MMNSLQSNSVEQPITGSQAKLHEDGSSANVTDTTKVQIQSKPRYGARNSPGGKMGTESAEPRNVDTSMM